MLPLKNQGMMHLICPEEESDHIGPIPMRVEILTMLNYDIKDIRRFT